MGGIVKKKIDTLSKPVFLCLDILKTEIQETVENKPVFICLDILKTEIHETVESKPSTIISARNTAMHSTIISNWNIKVHSTTISAQYNY